MKEKRSPIFRYRGFWLGRRADSPCWQIFWRQPGSRRLHRRSTRTPDLNLAKETLVGLAGKRGDLAVEQASWLRLDHALDLYEVSMRNKPSYRMVAPTVRLLKSFTRHAGIDYVSQFTLEHQNAYVEDRRKQMRAQGYGASNATINRELSVLSAALRHAWKCGRLTHPPYVVHLPDPPPRRRTLTREQCLRLMDACQDPHLYLFVKMAPHTLQRRGAILRLCTDQVDLADGLIDFNPPGAPQSNKRRPIIPITADLWPDLAKAVQASQSGFVIEYKGRPVASVKSGLRTACGRAGITPAISPNVLRHTSATLLAAAGVSMHEIAGMLGHSTTATTQRYAHHRPEYLEEAADAIDAALAK
jgi:integrase